MASVIKSTEGPARRFKSAGSLFLFGFATHETCGLFFGYSTIFFYLAG